jgi:hypothetical protein
LCSLVNTIGKKKKKKVWWKRTNMKKN